MSLRLKQSGASQQTDAKSETSSLSVIKRQSANRTQSQPTGTGTDGVTGGPTSPRRDSLQPLENTDADVQVEDTICPEQSESSSEYPPSSSQSKKYSMARSTSSYTVGAPHWVKDHGMSNWSTTVFVVVEVAGAGLLALPYAMMQTGYAGIGLNILCAVTSAYTGTLLGRCWMMVCEAHPEETECARSPYPLIGYFAFGKYGRWLVTSCINLTQFGATVVYLLLVSENIFSLTHQLSQCLWIAIVAGVICPFCWLGSPADFWFVGVAALLSTCTSCSVCMVMMIQDSQGQSSKPVHSEEFSVVDFFAAFGIICFAYGGHPGFPTLQVDMREPHHFGNTLLSAYVFVVFLYLPMAICGYLAYGSSTESNILNSLPQGPLLYLVQALLCCQLSCSFIIAANPICQNLEAWFRILPKFNSRRILLRTVLVGMSLLTAVSVPRFGPILSLIGGSTVTLLAYILPPVLYLRLSKMDDDLHKREVPLYTKLLLAVVVLIGLCAGLGSTVSAILELNVDTPCFVPD